MYHTMVSFRALGVLATMSVAGSESVAVDAAGCSSIAGDDACSSSSGLSFVQTKRTKNKVMAWEDPSVSSACKVGAGFSSSFQKRRLDVNIAARDLHDLGIQCVRLWDYDISYLKALLNVGIRDVLVYVPTHEIAELADGSHGSPNDKALSVARTLKPFANQGMSLRIAVGNEPLASWEGGKGNGPLLPAALEQMHAALAKEQLNGIGLTVPLFDGLLNTSYPSEKVSFGSAYIQMVKQVASVLLKLGGEFTLHLYPWFARSGNPGQVPLDLALGSRGASVDGRRYSGLMHMQVAAMSAALTQLDTRFGQMPLTIGESGWPSHGHGEATLQNAGEFARNAIAAAQDIDLPLDPHFRTLYLLEAFDEQKKPSLGHIGSNTEIENHVGLMEEDMSRHAPCISTGCSNTSGLRSSSTGAAKVHISIQQVKQQQGL